MGETASGDRRVFGTRARLKVAVWLMAILAGNRFRAEAQVRTAMAEGEPPGSDVFMMVREALVREKPSKQSRFTGKLPGGSRVKLIATGDDYLKIEVPAGATPKTTTGYISREVVSVFAPEATSELVSAARALSGIEGHRRTAVAFLLCASERLRTTGPGDAGVEVLLGETAEALAASGGPFPPGLELGTVPAQGAGPTRARYTGDAFRRAIALTSKTETPETARLRERAVAGVLRQQYPETSAEPAALEKETTAWLELAENAEDATALKSAAARAGDAVVSLAGVYVATGRAEDVAKLEARVRSVGTRIQTVLPTQTVGTKLLARAAIVGAMRGDGTKAFPQEARAKLGPKEIVARIDGKLGNLAVTVEMTVGGTHEGPRQKAARPILPVPGSLKISPDGKSVAWIEIATATKLVPVVASLEKEEPAREIVPMTATRPTANLLASLCGYSKDGQRLGVQVQAWNEMPGPDTRYSVVSVATGELLYETTKDTKSFQRLIQ